MQNGIKKKKAKTNDFGKSQFMTLKGFQKVP